MEKSISEIVGRAELPGGERTLAYRALRPLLCSACGAEIAAGTLFTRRSLAQESLRILPRCTECAPFQLLPERREMSPLLESLLAARPDGPAQDAHAAPASAPRRKSAMTREHDEKQNDEKLKEAVNSRLGPALKRKRLS
ncbi:MAG TPA: hypothetical protein VF723_14275 [Pyrinomonadaceae bacterium]|jgi:hypothetical protein